MPADVTFTTALEKSGALRDAVDLARSFPTFKLRVDSSGLGRISREVSEFQRSLQSSNARVLAFSFSAVVYNFPRIFKFILIYSSVYYSIRLCKESYSLAILFRELIFRIS